MHQVVPVNCVTSLNHIKPHSFSDNGCMSDALVNCRIGGRVGDVDMSRDYNAGCRLGVALSDEGTDILDRFSHFLD